MTRTQGALYCAWTATVILGVVPGAIPGVEPVQRLVAGLVPHASHRPVMFATVPSQVVSVRVQATPDAQLSVLADQLDTRAYGYATGRAFVNLMIAPHWLRHLCRTKPGLARAAFEVRLQSVSEPERFLPNQRLQCENGRLTGGDSSRL